MEILRGFYRGFYQRVHVGILNDELMPEEIDEETLEATLLEKLPQFKRFHIYLYKAGIASGQRTEFWLNVTLDDPTIDILNDRLVISNNVPTLSEEDLKLIADNIKGFLLINGAVRATIIEPLCSYL